MNEGATRYPSSVNKVSVVVCPAKFKIRIWKMVRVARVDESLILLTSKTWDQTLYEFHE